MTRLIGVRWARTSPRLAQVDDMRFEVLERELHVPHPAASDIVQVAGVLNQRIGVVANVLAHVTIGIQVLPCTLAIVYCGESSAMVLRLENKFPDVGKFHRTT